MESIEIKNFGPIKHVKLDLKDINVFIGTTASGKSTVAKLVTIVRSIIRSQKSDYEYFKELSNDYNIDFAVSRETLIEYKMRDIFWRLKNEEIETNFPERISDTFIFNVLKTLGIDVDKYPEEAKKKLFSFSVIYTLFFNEAKLTGTDAMKQTLDYISELKNFLVDMGDLIDGKDNEKVTFDQLQEKLTDLISFTQDKAFIDRLIYIPAERSLLSTVGESLFSLISNKVTIAESIKKFGSEYESARRQIKNLPLAFLEASYEHSDNTDYIKLKDGTHFELGQASSGFQSVVPLLIVVKANTDSKGYFKGYIIIEEPELNLYPTVQKDLLEFLVERINQSQNKLIITTHSPYILTALDNLIQADNVVRRNPDAKEEVKKLVPRERWVDFDRVACYYFENGRCRSTLDEEYRSIGPSNIDDVSEELGKVYDQLLNLEYADVS